jgi:hypothetical protein
MMLNFPTASYPAMASSNTSSSSISVPGAQMGDLITGVAQAFTQHLVLEGGFVASNNIVTLLWSTDGAGIASGTTPVLLRVDRYSRAPNSPPSAIA